MSEICVYVDLCVNKNKIKILKKSWNWRSTQYTTAHERGSLLNKNIIETYDLFWCNVFWQTTTTHATYKIMQRIKYCITVESDFSSNCTVEQISAFVAHGHSFTWISRKNPSIPISPIYMCNMNDRSTCLGSFLKKLAVRSD